jgi:hypothetical protein
LGSADATNVANAIARSDPARKVEAIALRSYRRRQLRRPADKELEEHAVAAAARFVGEGWRFVKPRGRDRWIDGLIAATIAVDVDCCRPAPGRRVYETRSVAWWPS